MRRSEFAEWALAAVIAVAAASAAAQQDEGPILQPKAKPKPSSATILVVCDLACTWNLDAKAMGSLAAGNSKKVPVSLGQHLLDAVTTDGHDKVEREIEVKTTAQTIMRFELQPVRDARLRSEKAVREQAARSKPQGGRLRGSKPHSTKMAKASPKTMRRHARSSRRLATAEAWRAAPVSACSTKALKA